MGGGRGAGHLGQRGETTPHSEVGPEVGSWCSPRPSRREPGCEGQPRSPACHGPGRAGTASSEPSPGGPSRGCRLCPALSAAQLRTAGHAQRSPVQAAQVDGDTGLQGLRRTRPLSWAPGTSSKTLDLSQGPLEGPLPARAPESQSSEGSLTGQSHGRHVTRAPLRDHGEATRAISVPHLPHRLLSR